MEIEHIRQELNELLENIQEHSNRYSDERPIPSLEISFIQTKVNKLQEKMVVLKYLLEKQENISKHAKPIENKTVEPTIEVEENITAVEDKIEEAIESVGPPMTENNTLGDTFENPPIAKLVDALTLNDRYLYANELFNKDMSAFNELVKSIDNSTSLNEALELISSKDWDNENEHVLSFQNLIERRFS